MDELGLIDTKNKNRPLHRASPYIFLLHSLVDSFKFVLTGMRITAFVYLSNRKLCLPQAPTTSMATRGRPGQIAREAAETPRCGGCQSSRPQ